MFIHVYAHTHPGLALMLRLTPFQSLLPLQLTFSHGFGTWTNGPVAVSYLSDLLDVPPTGYAFEAANGGGEFGATVDNAYTQSPAGAQSLTDQIANYTGSTGRHLKKSLQFIWIGEKGLSAHTDALPGRRPAQQLVRRQHLQRHRRLGCPPSGTTARRTSSSPTSTPSTSPP